jgi:hypothetical protein
MKHHAPQFDLAWDQPEDFALVQETATDWNRVNLAKAKQAQDKTEQEKKQENLFSR